MKLSGSAARYFFCMHAGLVRFLTTPTAAQL